MCRLEFQFNFFLFQNCFKQRFGVVFVYVSLGKCRCLNEFVRVTREPGSLKVYEPKI